MYFNARRILRSGLFFVLSIFITTPLFFAAPAYMDVTRRNESTIVQLPSCPRGTQADHGYFHGGPTQEITVDLSAFQFPESQVIEPSTHDAWINASKIVLPNEFNGSITVRDFKHLVFVLDEAEECSVNTGTLSLRNCPSILHLSAVEGHVQHLNVDRLAALETIDIYDIKELESVSLLNCPVLTECKIVESKRFTHLELQTPSLTKLLVYKNKSLCSIEPSCSLDELKILQIHGTKVKNINLSAFPSISVITCDDDCAITGELLPFNHFINQGGHAQGLIFRLETCVTDEGLDIILSNSDGQLKELFEGYDKSEHGGKPLVLTPGLVWVVIRSLQSAQDDWSDGTVEMYNSDDDL